MQIPPVAVTAGQVIRLGDQALTVSELAAEHLPAVRAYLLGLARAGGRVTYGEIKRDLALPWATNGMAHLLNVLSADCVERGEPSLAALVVAESTLEVGDAFTGNPEVERTLIYRRWLSRTVEGGGLEQGGPIRGVCPRCQSEEVTRVIWGLQTLAAYDDPKMPPWVTFGGCSIEPYDAICDSCGCRWVASEDGTTAVFRCEDDLFVFADTDNDGDLARWIDEDFELDAFIDRENAEAGTMLVGFRTRGTVIEFPIDLEEFWEQLADTHRDALDELEAEAY